MNARSLLVSCLFILAALPLYATDPCRLVHARAHLYGGDGQLRIWHIGTHHEYEPDEASWERVVKWLEVGVKNADKAKDASPASSVYLYAEFVVCPVEPLREGAVQRATIKRATHRRYLNAADVHER